MNLSNLNKWIITIIIISFSYHFCLVSSWMKKTSMDGSRKLQETKNSFSVTKEILDRKIVCAVRSTSFAIWSLSVEQSSFTCWLKTVLFWLQKDGRKILYIMWIKKHFLLPPKKEKRTHFHDFIFSICLRLQGTFIHKTPNLSFACLKLRVAQSLLKVYGIICQLLIVCYLLLFV